MESEQTEREYRHRVDVQMRFRDVDLFGHVNNNVYFEYFDLGKVEYIDTVLYGLFDTRKDALVIANINCDFLLPSIPREQLQVQTRVDGVGEHSIKLSQRVVNPINGAVKCRARVVMVGFDASTGQTKVIPDSWKARINEYEGDIF